MLPSELRTAVIHRLELPQGRFSGACGFLPASIDSVPPGRDNGCLVITLDKAEARRG